MSMILGKILRRRARVHRPNGLAPIDRPTSVGFQIATLGGDVRTHGWAGRPPADDDEAVQRILAAAKLCIDRDGAESGIAEVARELGVTRQTVYRYFPSTED